jgi:hypothetical protein
MTETDNLLSMIEDQQSEIADLKLCLKETNILLVASIGREKEGVKLMTYIKDVLGAKCMWGPYEKACKFLGVEK